MMELLTPSPPPRPVEQVRPAWPAAVARAAHVQTAYIPTNFFYGEASAGDHQDVLLAAISF